MKAQKIGDGMVVVEGIRYVNENRPRVLTCMEHEEYKKKLKQGQSLPIDSVVGQSEQLCDVCGSDDVIEAPSMGRNCNRCNPL
jgi:hypothetical protein